MNVDTLPLGFQVLQLHVAFIGPVLSVALHFTQSGYNLDQSFQCKVTARIEDKLLFFFKKKVFYNSWADSIA